MPQHKNYFRHRSKAVTERTLHDYQVGVISLSEVRPGDTGSRNTKVTGTDTHFRLDSSAPEIPDQQGVATALGHHPNSAPSSWQPISRNGMVRFKNQLVNNTEIAIYDPTLPTGSRVKEEF